MEDKEDLVKALASHPGAREALRAELQNPLKAALWRREFTELKELADVLDIPHEGVARWDLISKLASDPRVQGQVLPKAAKYPAARSRAFDEAPPKPPDEAPPVEGEPPPLEADALPVEPEPEVSPQVEGEVPPPPAVESPDPEPATFGQSPSNAELLSLVLPAPTADPPPSPPALSPAQLNTPVVFPLQLPQPEPPEVASLLALPPPPDPPAPPPVEGSPVVSAMPMPRPPPPRPPAEPQAAPAPTEEIVVMLEPEEPPPSPPVEGPLVLSPDDHPSMPPELQAKLESALPYAGDMLRLHHLLTEADRRWGSGDHAMALAQAREAIDALEAAEDRFLNSSWAHVLASMEALVWEARGPTPALEEARASLEEIRTIFASGDLRPHRPALDRAMSAMSALYLTEAERVRQDVTRATEKMRELAAMGGRVADIHIMLQKANEVLRSGDRGQGAELLLRATALMEEEVPRRLEELRSNMVAVEFTLQEASALGANTTEARRLLEQARVALRDGEGALTHELLQRAERTIAECQRTQIDRAMDLHHRQMEKVKELVRRIKPILAEGQGYGLDVAPARVNAKEALQRIHQGDYLNALLYAKQAAEATKALQPLIVAERARRGVVKPPGGICGRCISRNLEFGDDGWGRCRDCGMDFRWRRTASPQALLRRLKQTIIKG